jgi:leucyl-tRNA synthetase
MEHVTLHLLYSRFWHKFLYDMKLVPTKEPYIKRTAHGMILAEDGEKMSKSRGNVINPDKIIKLYGADTLRLYEMFIGPFDQTAVWNTNSIIGPRRFLEKIWRIGETVIKNEELKIKSGTSNQSFVTLLHKTIKKVTEDIESMSFNTAVSAMMMLSNEMEKQEYIDKKDFKIFLQLLAPFVPHIAEELWGQLKIKNEELNIHLSGWPKYDPKKIVESKMRIAIQVNGKLRGEMKIDRELLEDKIKQLALEEKTVIPWIEGKEIKRVIYVLNRLINIVV